MWLFQALSRHLGDGLDELTVTTNGSQLKRFAAELKAAGVEAHQRLARHAASPTASAPSPAGATSRPSCRGSTPPTPPVSRSRSTPWRLKGTNEDEIDDLIRFAHGRGYDLTLIETMPLGEIDGARHDQYLPLSIVRARLLDRWTLDDIPHRTGGPARYVRVRRRAAASASSRR